MQGVIRESRFDEFPIEEERGRKRRHSTIAQELLDEAAELIETKKEDPAETIHELRKQLMKWRA